MKVIILVIVTGLIFAFSCKQKRQVVYPEYSSMRNVVDSLPHLNDSTLLIASISRDQNYGRVASKPIFLGVVNAYRGGENRQKFFNALSGPNNEDLEAYRLKSCCPFKTLNSRTVGPDQKFGLLDIWLVSYEGSNIDTLYVNPYDEGELIAPTGYKIKQ